MALQTMFFWENFILSSPHKNASLNTSVFFLLNSPVDKVAEVIEKLTVVLQQQIIPAEAGVLGLRTYIEQIESEHVWRYPSVLCLVPKHSSTPALGKLAILVVQVFCKKSLNIPNAMISKSNFFTYSVFLQ